MPHTPEHIIEGLEALRALDEIPLVGHPPHIQLNSAGGEYVMSPDKTYITKGPDEREFSAERITSYWVDPTIWMEDFYPNENKNSIRGDNPFGEKLRAERAEWIRNFRTLEGAGTYTPNVKFDVEQPDWKEIVDIYDAIGPQLDSLLSDMATHPSDSLYSKNIRNKLLSGGLHLQGMDPYIQLLFRGIPSLVMGQLSSVPDATDTLGLGVVPNIEGMMDTFTHEMLHSADETTIHDTDHEQTSQLHYDKNVDYANRILYEQNPEGHAKVEKMLTEIRDANLNVDWLQPEDSGLTEEDFFWSKSTDLHLDKKTAELQFQQGIITEQQRNLTILNAEIALRKLSVEHKKKKAY